MSDISRESISKFVSTMTIVDVNFYDDPSAIHLFLVPTKDKRKATAMLTITAQDDGQLNIDLEGLPPSIPSHMPEPDWDESDCTFVLSTWD